MTVRTQMASWQRLEQLAKAADGKHLNQLFAADGERFRRYSLDLGYLFLDYSKNLIDAETVATLLALARDCELEAWRDRMFAGERINLTENRAVLHVALRGSVAPDVTIDGVNVPAAVAAELARMRDFVHQVRAGVWHGFSGRAITDVVNLGVGGSHLGPQMVTEALAHCSDELLRVHYVSNVDGAQIASVLASLDPETTLFVVSSKTFTTSETLTNARYARQWLKDAAGHADIHDHFVAVTADSEKAGAFGIPGNQVFHMWDWVGGRFSLWSAIGLPIALYLGFEQFEALLAGAHRMDEHFKTAPLEKNAPVLLALVALWNASFLGRKVHAVLPYEQALAFLPAYLQQAEMESNGKSTSRSGEALDYPTVACIFGGTGINGQHAYYQYLHQGNPLASADFIGAIEASGGSDEHHDILMANLFAQTEALMTGVDAASVSAELAAAGKSPEAIENLLQHKIHQGNRPTNTILLPRVDAKTLGALIALYEHKIFAQGVLLDICSFDQWGVELGKRLANRILAEMHGDKAGVHDASTSGLLAYYRQKKSAAPNLTETALPSAEK